MPFELILSGPAAHSPLDRLPPEVIQRTVDYLDAEDCKNLSLSGLTSKLRPASLRTLWRHNHSSPHVSYIKTFAKHGYKDDNTKEPTEVDKKVRATIDDRVAHSLQEATWNEDYSRGYNAGAAEMLDALLCVCKPDELGDNADDPEFDEGRLEVVTNLILENVPERHLLRIPWDTVISKRLENPRIAFSEATLKIINLIITKINKAAKNVVDTENRKLAEARSLMASDPSPLKDRFGVVLDNKVSLDEPLSPPDTCLREPSGLDVDGRDVTLRVSNANSGIPRAPSLPESLYWYSHVPTRLIEYTFAHGKKDMPHTQSQLLAILEILLTDDARRILGRYVDIDEQVYKVDTKISRIEVGSAMSLYLYRFLRNISRTGNTRNPIRWQWDEAHMKEFQTIFSLLHGRCRRRPIIGRYDELRYLQMSSTPRLYRCNSYYASSVMCLAVEANCDELVSFFADLGFDVNGETYSGQVPLCFARTIAMVDKLVDILGAAPDHPLRMGTIPESMLQMTQETQPCNISRANVGQKLRCIEHLQKKRLLSAPVGPLVAIALALRCHGDRLRALRSASRLGGGSTIPVGRQPLHILQSFHDSLEPFTRSHAGKVPIDSASDIMEQHLRECGKNARSAEAQKAPLEKFRLWAEIVRFLARSDQMTDTSKQGFKRMRNYMYKKMWKDGNAEKAQDIIKTMLEL